MSFTRFDTTCWWWSPPRRDCGIAALVYGIQLPMIRKDEEKELQLVACPMSRHMVDCKESLFWNFPIVKLPEFGRKIRCLYAFCEIEESYAGE
jgi:hypothetical protein